MVHQYVECKARELNYRSYGESDSTTQMIHPPASTLTRHKIVTCGAKKVMH